jgi:hypothetical protein
VARQRGDGKRNTRLQTTPSRFPRSISPPCPRMMVCATLRPSPTPPVSAKAEAVFVLQHDVENHEIAQLPSQDFEHGGAARCGRDDVTMLAKERRQQRQYVGVVVDQQKARHRRHSPNIYRAAATLMSKFGNFIGDRRANRGAAGQQGNRQARRSQPLGRRRPVADRERRRRQRSAKGRRDRPDRTQPSCDAPGPSACRSVLNKDAETACLKQIRPHDVRVDC